MKLFLGSVGVSREFAGDLNWRSAGHELKMIRPLFLRASKTAGLRSGFASEDGAIEESCFLRKGQYSHICANHLILLALAASASVGVTNLLKVALCPASSSSASNSIAASVAWSCSHILLRTVPSLSTAIPRSDGRAAAISLRILDASLHPFPDVVTPICSGPEVWVDNSVNVQRLGASATLIGILNLLQLVEMCVANVLLPPDVTNTASTTLGFEPTMRWMWDVESVAVSQRFVESKIASKKPLVEAE
ncbi:siroheme synthase [Hortaea werneckii]|nr:siroheme synthase [Hortaea werneckii]